MSGRSRPGSSASGFCGGRAMSSIIRSRLDGLRRSNGFYFEKDFSDANLSAALMRRDKVFAPTADGKKVLPVTTTPYHIENANLIAYLEWRAAQDGVRFRDGTVSDVHLHNGRVARLMIEGGGEVSGDFFVDASGFHSRLIGKTCGEPFVDFSDVLFCDRAVIGPRERAEGEVIHPYTTAETMDHGWCWQIDHEHHVNRGYVYCSAFVSDEDAEAEFRRQNPKVEKTRIVKFRSGHYRRAWVNNVVAVGNACGFVEPLEATALAVICSQCRTLATCLKESDMRPTESMIHLYNEFVAGIWREVRDFLAVHYRFNTRRDTPFWRHCREKTPLGAAEPLVEFYKENGPSLVPKTELVSVRSYFGIDGFYSMLLGMKVPHARVLEPTPQEQQIWAQYKAGLVRRAEAGIGVAQALALLRNPSTPWFNV